MVVFQGLIALLSRGTDSSLGGRDVICLASFLVLFAVRPYRILLLRAHAVLARAAFRQSSRSELPWVVASLSHCVSLCFFFLCCVDKLFFSPEIGEYAVVTLRGNLGSSSFASYQPLRRFAHYMGALAKFFN